VGNLDIEKWSIEFIKEVLLEPFRLCLAIRSGSSPPRLSTSSLSIFTRWDPQRKKFKLIIRIKTYSELISAVPRRILIA
jgi:hypothetical protein